MMKSTDRAKGDMKQLRPMLRYLKPYRAQAVLAFITMCFTSGSVLGMGSGLKHLIDEGLSKGDASLLNQSFMILLGVTVLLAAASYARFYLVTWVGERVVADIRRDVFQHLLRMHVGFFEETRIGEILSRLTTDTTLIQSVVGSSLSVAVRNSLMLIGGIVLLVITSAHLSSYLFLAIPVVVAPIVIMGRKLRSYARITQQCVADISGQAGETLNAIHTIQSFTLEQQQDAQFEQKTSALLSASHTRIRMRAFLTALVIVLVFGSIVTVLWFGGQDVLAGRITAGSLSSFVFYSIVVAGSVGALSEVVADIQRAAGAAERLRELLEMPALIQSPQSPEPIPVGAQDITFEEVSFAYPARPTHPTLQDINLTVPAGKTYALFGASGAGKTTLFQLLLRFYDVTSGAIRVGGVDVRAAGLDDLRRRIGIVPQDAVMFSGTVADNIRLGSPGATDDAVREAARTASALEFIERLPNGFDTEVGEKGIKLSGGQRQRIAIARAVLRGADILLLDEATSALDSENENAIKQALTEVSKGRTTLIIAHRLSTVTHADQIVLLDKGQISAIGTHAELMKHNEIYAKLAKHQFHDLRFID